ncbi:MAG: type II toxin-antitoxin system HicB family antitoxin [Nitrosomonas sp.]|nr:type II toxin-antitoxin system HicB family antitoxin [Nitrosomonas sp.]MDP1951129.1 type II toxin-antitoxin system HicB family antitoxin [Nitrosomonas sp.]
MNNKYELVIYWSNTDNRYIVEVPELPGCMADGYSYQDAVINIEVIIHEWIETANMLGREVPTPVSRQLTCPH